MKYSTGFRNAVLQQVLPPNNRSIASVARERGISPITINSWMKKLKDGTLSLDQDGTEPGPNWQKTLSLDQFEIVGWERASRQ